MTFLRFVLLELDRNDCDDLFRVKVYLKLKECLDEKPTRDPGKSWEIKNGNNCLCVPRSQTKTRASGAASRIELAAHSPAGPAPMINTS